GLSGAVSDHAAEGDPHTAGRPVEAASEGHAAAVAGEGGGSTRDRRCAREGDAVAAAGRARTGTMHPEPERTHLAPERCSSTEADARLTDEGSVRGATHRPRSDQPAAAAERGAARGARAAGLALPVPGVGRAEAMVSSRGGAGSRGRDCGSAEE